MIHQLLHQPRFLRARRVVGYFGRNGEIDPMPLLARAARPCTNTATAGSSSRAALCGSAAGIRANGCDSTAMAYPSLGTEAGAMIPARWLDVVVVPLLGFDSDCHRLGMGRLLRSDVFIRAPAPPGKSPLPHRRGARSATRGCPADPTMGRSARQRRKPIAIALQLSTQTDFSALRITRLSACTTCSARMLLVREAVFEHSV